MYANIRMGKKVTRRIAFTRAELAYLEAAAPLSQNCIELQERFSARRQF